MYCWHPASLSWTLTSGSRDMQDMFDEPDVPAVDYE